MSDLIHELGFYAAKKKWPKGLEEMPDILKRAAAALSEAEQRARREALEEAAKIAEEWRCSLRPGSHDRLLGHQDAAKQIADKIRKDLSPASEREQPEKYRNPGIFHDAEGRN